MKALALLAALLSSSLAFGAARDLDSAGFQKALHGQPTYLGVITAGGSSTTNASTETSFTLQPGMLLLIQCSAAADILPAASVTADTGIALAEGEKFYLLLKGRHSSASPRLAVIGTTSCHVWSLE